jgi:hypothetical protein
LLIALGTDLASVNIAGAPCLVGDVQHGDGEMWDNGCLYCSCADGVATCEDYCDGGGD